MRIPQILRKLLDYSPLFESKRRSGNIIYTVAGPSDKVGGRRSGHPDPEISGGESGGGLRIFFRPFGPQFGLRIWGGGGGAPGPSLGSAPVYDRHPPKTDTKS